MISSLLVKIGAFLSIMVMGTAFLQVTQPNSCVIPKRSSCHRSTKSIALSMDFGKFINDAFNFGDNNSTGMLQQDYITDDEEEYGYIGCSNIFKIKVKSLKVGGCRLYLSLFLVGETNNPEKGTWRMDQNGDGGIDLYHKDTTGAMMILFEEDQIIVNRMGSAPSMAYLMSESTILNGMLDQLDEIAFDTSIEEKHRLICLHEPGDAIDVVRGSLSFN
jgi:hypothetical protein